MLRSSIRGLWLLPVVLVPWQACGFLDEVKQVSANGAGDNGTSYTTYGAGGTSTPGTSGGGGAGGIDTTTDIDSGAPPINTPRIDVKIDADWKFNRGDVPGAEGPTFDDSAWSGVSLPHTWNNLDGQNGPTTTPSYWRGIGWYRKHYTVPADTMTGKKLYLQFDASAYITDVWVNGTAVGSHSGGYAAFRFDITASAKVGADNVIAVKVDNSQGVDTNNNLTQAVTNNVAPLSGDFTMFGGIYRDLHVLATNSLAISPMDFGSSGVYLKTTNVSAASADLTATVKLLNGGAEAKNASVDVALLDATGATVQTFTGTASVPANGAADAVVTGTVQNPHLWNGLADPYVYKANVTVKDGANATDAVQQSLGFRFYAVDPNQGFSLNGKPLPLRGVCMHQDHKDKGGMFSPRDIDNDFVILKEIGANFIRFAHYQHSQYTYDKADQAGIVAWAENAFVNRINATQPFADNTKQQITELIRQNYNHPAIFFWSLGNEVLLKAGPDPLNVVKALAAVVSVEDPTRTSIYAANAGDENNGTNWQAQATSFNEYQGWYWGKMADFATWADQIHANHATKLVGVSEYGAGASIALHGLPINETGTDRTGGYQTEEYQAVFHETYYQAIAARPFFLQTSVWNMFDFASDYRNEGSMPGLNTKGIVTYDRQTKKDAFYYYKANWSSDPFVYIAYRRFTAMPKSATEIKVYSNQPEVEVKLNGTSLGKKQSANHIFSWQGVTWAAGANAVEASDTAGKATVDTVTWTN